MLDPIDADTEKILKESSSIVAHLPIPFDCNNTQQDVAFALNYCRDKLLNNIEYSPKAFNLIDAVVDKTWQELNTGCWKDVPSYFRDLYAYASFLKSLTQLKYAAQDTVMRIKNLKDVLETIDRGLLLGSSCRKELCRTASLLCELLNKVSGNCPNSVFRTLNQNKNINSSSISSSKVKPIFTLQRPSVEFFRENYFMSRKPVKLKDCIEHWPALKTWQNINYIVQKIGPRLVPIEIGKTYTSSAWSQKLMTAQTFIEKYVLPENPKQIGYLAQHQLFNQIPELLIDIREPEYCVLSENYDEDEYNSTDVNAWFGPANTVSPFHYDPKHNLLAQVVGSKRVLLVDPVWNDNLYPFDDQLLFNTAQVDPENPIYEKFPKFADVEFIECILEPGDMLYIPPKWWHHIRSLSVSISISFWWGKKES